MMCLDYLVIFYDHFSSKQSFQEDGKQLRQACRLYQRSVMMAPDHASLSLNLMHLSLHLATEFE